MKIAIPLAILAGLLLIAAIIHSDDPEMKTVCTESHTETIWYTEYNQLAKEYELKPHYQDVCDREKIVTCTQWKPATKYVGKSCLNYE